MSDVMARFAGMPLSGADVPRHPVRRVQGADGHELTRDSYPASIPGVAQLLAEGLDLSPGVTFLVGENGSGKSTIVEAVATAFGMSPEGGSTHSQHSSRPTESSLGGALQIVRGVGASRWGFFLRAETMHGWYSYMESLHAGVDGPPNPDPLFHEMSHGESFLAVLESRFSGQGLLLPRRARGRPVVLVDARPDRDPPACGPAARPGAVRHPLPGPRLVAGCPDPRGG